MIKSICLWGIESSKSDLSKDEMALIALNSPEAQMVRKKQKCVVTEYSHYEHMKREQYDRLFELIRTMIEKTTIDSFHRCRSEVLSYIEYDENCQLEEKVRRETIFSEAISAKDKKAFLARFTQDLKHLKTIQVVFDFNYDYIRWLLSTLDMLEQAGITHVNRVEFSSDAFGKLISTLIEPSSGMSVVNIRKICEWAATAEKAIIESLVPVLEFKKDEGNGWRNTDYSFNQAIYLAFMLASEHFTANAKTMRDGAFIYQYYHK